MPDRVALVTGAGRGIGAAIARSLAGDGVRVCVADLDGASEVAAEIGGLGVELDVSSPASCEAAAASAASALGPLSILVNNAGVTRSSFLHRMSDADWELVTDVVLRGTFNMTRAVAPWFRDGVDASRRVVNVASIAGVYGSTGAANYVAAKAGVIGLTRTTSQEWARYGVTANAICPGIIETQMLSDSVPSPVLEALRPRIPLGRLGRPSDIGAAAAFLCGPDASYITGQVLEVAGGFRDMTPHDLGA